MKQAVRQLWHLTSLSNSRQWLSDFGLLAISLLLAIVVWSFVTDQTNPLQRERIENIPLRVENVPPDAGLIPSPPASVAAIIQTTEAVFPSLSSRAFQAVVSLFRLFEGMV